MKFRIGILILIVALIVLPLTAFSSGIAYAYSGKDIEVIFSNNNVSFTPETIEAGYSFEYIPDMIVRISCRISGDKTAKSQITIKKNGETQNAILSAGTYNVTAAVQPSDGSDFIYRTFEVQVTPKRLESLSFDAESINIEFGDTLEPKVILSEDVAKNTTTTFDYYADSTKTVPIDKPTKSGTYYVVATVSGLNYIGEVESELHIAKSTCMLEANNPNPDITYSKSAFGDYGADLVTLLDIKITNTNSQSHSLVSYIKVDGEFVEQPTIVFPGEYEYKVFFLDGENYTASPLYGTITVHKAQPEFEFLYDLKLVYHNGIDVKEECLKFCNADGGFTIKNTIDDSTINLIELNVKFFDENGVELLDSPSICGNYQVQFRTTESEFYLPSTSEIKSFTIAKRDISGEITTFGEQSIEYGVDYDFTNKFTIPESYAVTPSFVYKKLDDNGEVTEELSEKPTSPGKYAIVLSINADNVFATKTLVYNINKLNIPLEKITVSGLSYIYGDNVSINVEVDSSYGITGDDITFIYRIKNGDKLDKKPTLVGNYEAEIIIDSDIYSVRKTVDFNIAKKDLKIKALSKNVVYGDKLFVKQNDAYLASDFEIVGLVSDSDIPSILSNITVYVGDDSYTTNNMNMVVGDYKMTVSGVNPNYNVIDVGSGVLTVTKRQLNVSVANITQYVGTSYSPTITVSNSVYNDLAENMALLFEVYFTADEAIVENPSSVGEYDIAIKIKADNVDCQELKNYTIKYTYGKLTLLDNQKTDNNNHITLVGRFDQSVNFSVNEIKANDSVNEAIKAIDSKYEVDKLLYIPYTFETVDKSAFKLKINVSGMETKNLKVMIGYSTQVFEETAFTIEGNFIVLKLDTMASYYAICREASLPFLIIIIAIVAGVVVIGVVVILILYFKGAFIKSKKNDDVALSGAVVRKEGVKSDDDELDELIENFDQSSVVVKEDPAKRIQRTQEMELREQYRLKLKRMRSTDKTLSDTISNLGLSNNDFDEEAAIDRLIEEDRKEKQRQDEENRRLREENEKKQQQETGFVINERKGGTLNQTTNPVKPNSIIDDDDDIIDV